MPITIKTTLLPLDLKPQTAIRLLKIMSLISMQLLLRVYAAGAIILGKTNLPPLAMIFRPISLGITNNPWDISRTPGGSTGGGAAAVAAGLTSLEIGNDLAGSNPHSFPFLRCIRPKADRIPCSSYRYVTGFAQKRISIFPSSDSYRSYCPFY